MPQSKCRVKRKSWPTCPRAMDGDLCCVSFPENPDKDAYPPLVLELPFPQREGIFDSR